MRVCVHEHVCVSVCTCVCVRERESACACECVVVGIHVEQNVDRSKNGRGQCIRMKKLCRRWW